MTWGNTCVDLPITLGVAQSTMTFWKFKCLCFLCLWLPQLRLRESSEPCLSFFSLRQRLKVKTLRWEEHRISSLYQGCDVRATNKRAQPANSHLCTTVTTIWVSNIPINPQRPYAPMQSTSALTCNLDRLLIHSLHGIAILNLIKMYTNVLLAFLFVCAPLARLMSGGKQTQVLWKSNQRS